MAYENIKQLYSDVLEEIISSESTWRDFLKFSSRFYKYGFENTTLLYGQRKDATMVASLSEWNKITGRYVNKGSKSIKLFDFEKSNLIQHVFDVTDTNGPKSTIPTPWEITSELSANLGQLYADKFGIPYVDFKNTADFLINKNINDKFPAFVENFSGQINNLYYNGIIDDYFHIVLSSVTSVVYERCGIPTDEIVFKELSKFCKPALTMWLGTSVNGISHAILKDIANSIILITKKNRSKRDEQNTDRVHPGSRRDVESNVSNNDGGTSRQVRSNGTELSEEQQSRSIQPTSDGGQLGARNAEDRSGSVGQNGNIEETVIRERSLARPDGYDRELRAPGTNTPDSRGNSVKGIDLHSKIITPTNRPASDQLSLFDLPSIPHVDIPQVSTIKINETRIIKEIVLFGTGNVFDKFKLSSFFKKNRNAPIEELSQYLSTLYKNEVKELTVASDINATVSFGDDIKVTFPKHEDNELTISWEEATTVILENELFRYTTTKEMQILRDLEVGFLFGDSNATKQMIYSSYTIYGELNSERLSAILQGKAWDFNLFDNCHISCLEDIVILDSVKRGVNSFSYEEVAFLLNAKFPNADYLHYGDFVPSEEIKNVLTHGQCHSWKREKLYSAFTTENLTIPEKQKLVKSLFNNSGSGGPILSHNEHGGWDGFGKGIKITSYLHPDKKIDVTWAQAAKYIDSYIKTDTYFTETEKLEIEAIEKLIIKSISGDFKDHITESLENSEKNYYEIGEKVIKADLLDKTFQVYLSNSEVAAINYNNDFIRITSPSFRGIVFSYSDLASKIDTMWGRKNHLLSDDLTLEQETYVEALSENSSANNVDIDLSLNNEEVTSISPPGLSESTPTNFVMPDDLNLFSGSKTKFKQNIEAIKMLNILEVENRMASPEEQLTLAKYAGWGGLASVFDPNNGNWASEYTVLKELLNDKDYAAAKESTLTSHYTDKPIIDFTYKALTKFGFKGGNLLDPSIGIGNFYGRLPEIIKSNSNLYGVELDSLTGRMAKKLYPQANISVQGFEDTDFSDNFFDVAIGNVPFGSYKLHDPKYNKHNFLIHDYFFAKTLDKVRPGGIIAFISSKGTLDKANPSVRKYISERADLIGAVRLPNTAFKQIAGTEVTSDIIFLQKKERLSLDTPDWVYTALTEDEVPVNQYYIDNPDMLLGKMAFDNKMFGEGSNYTTCIPSEDFELTIALENVLTKLKGNIQDAVTISIDKNEKEVISIAADSTVKNHTYSIIDGKVFYRENSFMRKMSFKAKVVERIISMDEIRHTLRNLIDIQVDGCSKAELEAAQSQLNIQYDSFVDKYGYLSSKENDSAFRNDNDYTLLRSLEFFDKEGNPKKSDIFTTQTIRPIVNITEVETATEALFVSLNMKGCVDLEYMSTLYKKTTPEIIKELQGLIFLNPQKYIEGNNVLGYEPADEYLSGNVREKLITAKLAATKNTELFSGNVQALQAVQPEKIEAAEIRVKMGVNWIEISDYEAFMYELFKTPFRNRNDYTGYNTSNHINITYNKFDSSWSIKNKSYDSFSITTTQTYGTKRMSAYEIMEASLNQREAIVRDRVDLADDKYKYVINRKETEISKEKQSQIQEAFRDWLFTDPDRREKYVRIYNEKFNSSRLREFDGSHQTFPGMNPITKLRPHQLNAIARAKYSGNTLLAHAVGAGKTYEMDAIIMEKKRLSLINKACMVVPNHLTEQAGSEFLYLYPSANILVSTKKDFETKNRKTFISRIATGEYDCVIMGFTQFEKISMSAEYREAALKTEIDEISEAISLAKEDKGQNFTVKQLQRLRKGLEAEIKGLLDEKRKDDVINFEQLGFDFLVVDEAHNYKNCSIFTKMRNIAGISETRAKKSFDMLMKCRYMNDLTNYSGVVFATGTPVSNSMIELFVMKRYLRPDILARQGLSHFDNWAALYGEVISSLELAPSGNGFRLRQRFAKFVNIPELLATFKEFADIQTADMLTYLPIPDLREGGPITISADADEFQKEKIVEFSERMEAIHNGSVDPSIDNALKITHEARLVGTDPRLLSPLAPNNPDSKVNKCIDIILKEYQQSSEIRGVQLVFCDIGTPKDNKETFTIYQYIKSRLVSMNIPENEIAFAHDAKTEIERAKQFTDLRSGKIRIAIASTAKMGTGANVQDKLVALHHLDIPWKPSDIEQRNGRILRQGNINKEVSIYQYVTKGTFDAYMWGIVENKQKFISQVMTSKAVARICDDIDETVLSYAEVKAIATGDPRIKEKMQLDMEISRLQSLKASFNGSKHSLQDKIMFSYPEKITELKQQISNIKKDIELRDNNKSEEFSITLNENTFTEREPAGEYLSTFKDVAYREGTKLIGYYKGFSLYMTYNTINHGYELVLKGSIKRSVELSESAIGNTVRLDNALTNMDTTLIRYENSLQDTNRNLEQAKIEFEKQFSHEEELRDNMARQILLNSELDLDKPDSVIVDENIDKENDELQYESLEESPDKVMESQQEYVISLIKKDPLKASAFVNKIKELSDDLGCKLESLIVENNKKQQQILPKKIQKQYNSFVFS